MNLFKRYGCGCIGIPVEQFDDDTSPTGKGERALCVEVCDDSRYDPRENDELAGFVDRKFRLDEQDQFLSNEEQDELLGKIRRQMREGGKYKAIRRLLTQ